MNGLIGTRAALRISTLIYFNVLNIVGWLVVGMDYLGVRHAVVVGLPP